MKRKEALSQATSLVSGLRGQGKDVALKPAEVQLVKNRHCEIKNAVNCMVVAAQGPKRKRAKRVSRTPTSSMENFAEKPVNQTVSFDF